MPVTTIDTKTALQIRVLSRTRTIFPMFPLVSEKPVRPKIIDLLAQRSSHK
jgi:hypothetical protein